MSAHAKAAGGKTLRNQSLLLLLVSAAWVGCRPAGEPARPQVALHPSLQPASNPSPGWDWSAFPQATELLVAQLPGTLTAPRTEIVRAPAAGRLHILPAATHAGALASGTEWARLQPEDAAAEAKALARAEAQLKERREHYRQTDWPAALARLDEEISTAQETVALAKFAERSPELFQGEGAPLDPRLRPHATAAQAEAALQRLRDRRAGLERSDPAFEPAELQSLASALERAQTAHDERQSHLSLAAPFAGTLRLARSPEAGDARVEAGEIIGKIEDTSFVEISVRAGLPLLHAVEPSTLFCRVALPGQAEAVGAFRSWGMDAGGAGGEPVLRFRLTSAPSAAAENRLLDVALPVLVFTRLPAPARIVPKLALAEADQTGILEGGWREGVSRLFPGSRWVAEGRAAIALTPP